MPYHFAVFLSSADTRQTPSHQPRALRHTCHRQEGQPRPTIKPNVSVFFWLYMSCWAHIKRIKSQIYDAAQRDFLCQSTAISYRLPLFKYIDSSCNERFSLISIPPHKQPLRPWWGEPTRLLQLLNHARLLCMWAHQIGSVSMAWSCWITYYNIMSPPSFDTNVPVGVLCSDVPTSGTLQNFL